MKADLDPKSILEQMEKGEPLPFDSGAIQLARQLSASLDPLRAQELQNLPEPLALAVLEAAIRAEKVDFADTLSNAPSKNLAKAAKKALYRLRSRGVAVPEPKLAGPAAVTSAAEPREELPSLLSAITGEGEQAVVLARNTRGGFETAHLVLSDERGVIDVQLHDSSRSGYRAILRDLKNRKTPAIAISLEEARRTLSRAVAKNLQTNTPFPSGLDDVMRHFGISPSAEPIAIPESSPEDAGLVAEGAKLHEEPEIRAWLPPMEQLRVFALKMDEIAQSQLYINEAQRSEQVSRLVHSMASSFFTPEISQLYAGRLWIMADYFERTGREVPAKWARAEARRLSHPTQAAFSRFAEQLFAKVVELTRQAAAGENLPGPEEESPSNRSERAERRSPGGLILP